MTHVGIIMKELEELKLGPLLIIQNNSSFFFTRESRSKLGVEVLVGGDVGTNEKTMKIS